MNAATTFLTVRVATDIRQRLKMYSAITGRSSREIVGDALTRELDKMQLAGGQKFCRAVDAIRRYHDSRNPPDQGADD